MNLLYLHMLFVFLWAIFMVSLAKSVECGEKSKISALLSLIFMLLVLFMGTKLMLLFPNVSKSGQWIHIKLSIAVLAMLINIYLAFVVYKDKKVSAKIAKAIYWLVIVMFIFMYVFTLYKPF